MLGIAGVGAQMIYRKRKSMHTSNVFKLPGADTVTQITGPQAELVEALAPARADHPERMGATPARLGEVLNVVTGCSQLAGDLIDRVGQTIGIPMGSFAPLTAQEAALVAGLLAHELDAESFAKVVSMIGESELSTDEVILLHRRHKIPVSQLEDDVLPVAGEGATIRDSLGNVLLDLDSNYSATNLGNSNLEIATGLFNQASSLISQKEDRIQVARARFLKSFKGLLPDSLDCFYWQSTGGEAVDKALKIAKAYTGSTGVVAFEGGFHGRTHGAVAVTYNKRYRTPFGLDHEPWAHFAPFGDLEAVEKLLAAGKARSVILELVQGEEAGIRPASREFAQGLRALCDTHGALMILDEVQTGFARVADRPGSWFACQRYGVVPDLITIGKSFGGGYPVTAVVTGQKISQVMQPGYDGSTFGGNPMAMVAALIATRQMQELDLPVAVAERSKQIASRLSSIDSPLVKGFRAVGLMIGIDLVDSQTVAQVQQRMLAHGAHSSLSTGATMRWMPPLVITEAQTDAVLDAFELALQEVEAG
jgi:acetylornithine/succinyldiaminopimelate/putrescine aminotransferase